MTGIVRNGSKSPLLLLRLLAGITVFQLLAAAPSLYAETGPAIPAVPAPVLSEPADGSARAPAALQPDRISGRYVTGYFSDTGRILASPASWDGCDWLKAGLVIGATSGLYFADADIRDAAQRNQSSTANSFARIGNALGDPLYTLPPLGIFYLYGHLSDDPKARRAALLSAESLAVSGLFTWTVKFAAQRPRPYTGAEPSDWNGPGFKSSDTSFPSGHTTAAFSIASVLAEEYGSNPVVPPIAYSLATLTGFARIYDNKHWASDTLFGGAIGYFVGKAVVRYHTAQGTAPLKVLPAVSRQGFGVIAEYRF